MSPSFLHEALISLFRDRPELAAEVLRDQLHIAIPAYTEATVQSGDLGLLKPVEMRADLVVLFKDGKPVMVVVIEVQLHKAAAKRRVWASYLASAGAQYACDAYVLVVTPHEDVARWAREPIRLGGSSVVQVLVLGPETIPVITDAAEAERHLELSVISALAHGPHRPEVAFATIAALKGVNDAVSTLYFDLLHIVLPQAVRAALEELMIPGYQYQSDFAKKYYGQGKAEGKAEGEAMGEAKGKADAILAVLVARSIGVSDEQRAILLATHDLAQLDQWLTRAATCSRASEVFAP